MATGNGNLRALTGAAVSGMLSAAQNGGRVKNYIEIFDLSLASVAKAINDDNLCFDIPGGEVPLSLNVQSSVSLTTSQLRFGTKAVPDSLGAAAAYGTTANALIEYLRATVRGRPLTARTRVFMSILSANLPSSGIIVVEMETCARG